MLKFIEKITKNSSNKYLIIFLHGYGCDKHDLMGLSDRFDIISRDICYISVDAPYKCETGFGYQWFSMEKECLNLDKIQISMRKNFELVDSFIKEQSKRLNIPYKNIFLIGFSQGSMVSLFVSLRLSEKIGGIIAFSGLQPDNIESLKIDLKTNQNILLIHGTDDQVVPYSMFLYSEKLLNNFNINLQTYSCKNLNHTINNEGINEAIKFLENYIKK